jgi:hypothetical protein
MLDLAAAGGRKLSSCDELRSHADEPAGANINEPPIRMCGGPGWQAALSVSVTKSYDGPRASGRLVPGSSPASAQEVHVDESVTTTDTSCGLAGWQDATNSTLCPNGCPASRCPECRLCRLSSCSMTTCIAQGKHSPLAYWQQHYTTTQDCSVRALHTWPTAWCIDVCSGAHQNQLPIALWRPSLPAPTLFMYAIMSLSHCANYVKSLAL